MSACAELALLTTREMAAADRAAIAAGTPGRILMQRAGRAVADLAAAQGGGAVHVLCGPGNNGGDGFVAARILASRGFAVTLSLLGDRAQLRGDAGLAAAEWAGPVAAATDWPPGTALQCAGQHAEGQRPVIVDALFGAGLSRDLDGAARDLVERINAAGCPVVAVDVPSGIDGDSGAVRGAAVRATDTVTFVRRKPGHLLMPGRLHCGNVHVADIGIDTAIVDAQASGLFANAPPLWLRAFPRPAADAHKYSRGHAVVVSGGIASTGAARLAARAALRAGAGLVTLASPPAALAVNAAQLTAVMVRPVAGAEGLAAMLADRRISALLIGPGAGLGQATRRLVEAGAAAARPLVLDADALTAFTGDIKGLQKIVEAARPAAVALTPHEGEFAKLFKALLDDTEKLPPMAGKLGRALSAARASGAVIVLKGPDTVIAAPDGRAAINETGAPWLATAGSGDVLAGFLAGLMAQDMPAWEAACAAVWLHGQAGATFGPGLIAEDLPDLLPALLRALPQA